MMILLEVLLNFPTRVTRIASDVNESAGDKTVSNCRMVDMSRISLGIVALRTVLPGENGVGK